MFDASQEIAVIAPGEGEVLSVLGAPMIVKSQSETLFIAEHIVPPGYCAPPHVHDADEEAFCILEGRLTLFDGAAERLVGAGDVARFAAGVRHGFRNDTQADVRFLVLCAPGVQALRMFRALDSAARAEPLTPGLVGEIVSAYGVQMD